MRMFDRQPLQFGELINHRLAVESAPTARFGATIGCLCLIRDSRPVDMHGTGIEPHGHVQSTCHVGAALLHKSREGFIL